MVAYADLILPDTTYLERYDCISMLDRPISDPDSPADAIRHPVVEPDRDVRGFQDVMIDLGARLKLPAITTETARPNFLAATPTTSSITSGAPASVRSPVAAARTAKSSGGRAQPAQLEKYIADGSFHQHHLPEHMRYFRHVNKDYIEWALDKGMRRASLQRRSMSSSTASPCRGCASPHAGTVRSCRLSCTGRASRPTSIPLPFCVSALRGWGLQRNGLPHARHHAAADGDVSRLGFAERLAAADPRQVQALHEPRARQAARHRGRRLGMDHEPHRPGGGTGQADGGRRPRHGVDLERYRQTRWRLGPRLRERPRPRAASCSIT